MKVVKWIVIALAGLLALAALTLLAMGRRDGAGQLRGSVEIDSPPDQVWPWLLEPEKLRAWVGWLVEVNEPAGPVTGKGSRQVWVMEDRNNKNQRMDIAGEVTEFDAPRRIAMRVTVPGGFHGDVTYVLQPAGEGRTRLDYQGVYLYEHWMAKLFEPLITPQAQKKLEEDLARLQSLAGNGV